MELCILFFSCVSSVQNQRELLTTGWHVGTYQPHRFVCKLSSFSTATWLPLFFLLQWSSALPTSECVCVCVRVLIWQLWRWQQHPLIYTRVEFSRLSVHLRTTEEENVEEKVFECLGEGAGAEEEGEMKFWILTWFGRFKFSIDAAQIFVNSVDHECV